MLDQGRAHVLDDQLALEALVRFSNDEIKHQELFRRMEAMMGAQIASWLSAGGRSERRGARGARGQHLVGAGAHLSYRAVRPVALRESIAPREELCPLFKDVFKFHWKDESQHVVLDELEWKAEHAKLSPARARPGRGRSDRAGGGRRRDPAGTVGGRCRLLHCAMSRVTQCRRGSANQSRACWAPTAGSTSSRACSIRTSAGC